MPLRTARRILSSVSVNFFGNGKDFVFVSFRYRDYAVGVAAQNITCKNPSVADVDGPVYCLELHTILSGAHRIAAAEHGITDFSSQMRVAASAIDDRAGKLSAMRHHGENVSPDRCIFAPRRYR